MKKDKSNIEPIKSKVNSLFLACQFELSITVATGVANPSWGQPLLVTHKAFDVSRCNRVQRLLFICSPARDFAGARRKNPL